MYALQCKTGATIYMLIQTLSEIISNSIVKQSSTSNSSSCFCHILCFSYLAMHEHVAKLPQNCVCTVRMLLFLGNSIFLGYNGNGLDRLALKWQDEIQVSSPFPSNTLKVDEH